jgi:hypothetical protein
VDMRSNGMFAETGGGYVKLKIVMADAKATAPSLRVDGPDDAEARGGDQCGAPRGWWVSILSGSRQMPLLPPRRGVPALGDN